jgi:hypothetical protein
VLLLTILATALPFAVYIAVGLHRSSSAKSVSDYFIYDQHVSVSDYANTSVGYALQMAAVFLFAYWGVKYGLGALWTPLFWLVGFALLTILLPRFIRFHGQRVTMHEYLARTFNAGQRLQRIAACATIVGLWGTMMAEIDYTVQLYSPVIKTERGMFILGAAFLIFGVVYIIVNGYKAEVNTERFQVPIAFMCFIAVLLLSLPAVWKHAGVRAYWIIWALLAITFIGMLIGKLMLGARAAFSDPQILVPIGALSGLIAVQMYLVKAGPIAGNASSVLDLSMRSQIWAQGPLALVALLIANALWMPVDLSTWQRIASVQPEKSNLIRDLRRGTLRVLFESPGSWMLGVALGLIISTGGFLPAGADPYQALGSFASALANGAIVSPIIYLVFLIGCLAIMLSTVNSIISAISYTAFNDLPSFGKEKSISLARWWTISLVVAGMVVYPYLRLKLGANLPTILYGAYSAQLSLVVVAFVALLRNKLERRAAFWSIICGFIGTAVSVIIAIYVPGDDTSVLSGLFAFVSALVGYVLFFDRNQFNRTIEQQEATKNATIGV